MINSDGSEFVDTGAYLTTRFNFSYELIFAFTRGCTGESLTKNREQVATTDSKVV